MTSLDIVNLITNNPITKLNANNNNKLLEKVKANFTEMEQQLFIASFYTYLNYDKTADFIVDIDYIWKWLGFNRKFNATSCLKNNFIINKDYKYSDVNDSFATARTGAKNTGSGGHNIQKFFLNIKTFKSLCLKAQTKKADEIHEYYIKLEELINEVLEEEALEMKNKLLIKDNLITNAIQDKLKAIEKTLVSQFPVNCECIYFGTIDNSNAEGEKLIKFGHSNNLSVRLQDHHKTYENFILRDAFKVHNKQEIENAIKTSSKIRKHLRTIEVDGKNKNEILAYDETNFTIPCISRYIKNIISEKSYSIEKFNILVEENQKYKATLEQLSDENEKLKVLNNEYIEKNEKLEQLLASITNNYENNNETINVNSDETVNVNNDETNIISAELKNKFDKFIDECCFLHKEVEVASTTIVGQFRIYNREKPTKLVFSMFNTYMRTRFLACRISGQNKNQVVHGFKGIKLKDIVYKKSSSSNEVENFIFESCIFSPEGRASTNKIVEEFINYKKNNSLLINNNEDKDVKNYLKNCQYILGGPIRLHNINATYEGYYGISLKNDYYQEARDDQIATSGKKVQKIDASTKNILNNWTTIAKAAIHEDFSPAKMSRAIKNNTLINNAYYVLAN
jgi:phage anti-repressor protein